MKVCGQGLVSRLWHSPGSTVQPILIFANLRGLALPGSPVASLSQGLYALWQAPQPPLMMFWVKSLPSKVPSLLSWFPNLGSHCGIGTGPSAWPNSFYYVRTVCGFLCSCRKDSWPVRVAPHESRCALLASLTKPGASWQRTSLITKVRAPCPRDNPVISLARNVALQV